MRRGFGFERRLAILWTENKPWGNEVERRTLRGRVEVSWIVCHLKIEKFIY